MHRNIPHTEFKGPEGLSHITQITKVLTFSISYPCPSLLALGRALAKGKKLLNKQFIEKYHFG
jgi:hypothetical protein